MYRYPLITKFISSASRSMHRLLILYAKRGSYAILSNKLHSFIKFVIKYIWGILKQVLLHITILLLIEWCYQIYFNIGSLLIFSFAIS